MLSVLLFFINLCLSLRKSNEIFVETDMMMSASNANSGMLLIYLFAIVNYLRLQKSLFITWHFSISRNLLFESFHQFGITARKLKGKPLRRNLILVELQDFIVPHYFYWTTSQSFTWIIYKILTVFFSDNDGRLLLT